MHELASHNSTDISAPSANQLTVEALARLVCGHLETPSPMCEQALVGRIVTDSRQVELGNVFWALPGPRFNGAEFAAEAFARGAAGVVGVGCSLEPPAGRWLLHVDHATHALTQLARWQRDQFDGTVIAVTGSVGKTTTRQMIAAALSARFRTVSSPENYNNEIGLPLSLLQLQEPAAYGVFELAARRRGEIQALCDICRPHVGVITTIGESHLGSFGTRAAVADAKAELLDAIPTDGLAVLNGDDPWLRRLAVRAHSPIVWVGRGGDCDLVATHVRWSDGILRFEVSGQEVAVPVWGRHHLTAALTSIAVARAMGLSLAEIATALAGFHAPPMRCEVVQRGGVTVINDAYNASPASMRAALDLLRETASSGRRVVVCGDMRELGPESLTLHRWLGDAIVTRGGADMLVACGQFAVEVADAARAAGMPAEQIINVPTVEDAIPELPGRLRSGDVVLLKGSRALALERLLQSFGAVQRFSYADQPMQETRHN